MMPEINPFWISKYEVARGFRGKRHELRKHFETANNGIAREFYSDILNTHTKLMFKNFSPIRSYLWKAEKDGNLVHLFGDIHAIYENFGNPGKFQTPSGSIDYSSYYSSYFHPTVLKAFEDSDKLYVEFFNYKHIDKLLENKIAENSEESESDSDESYDTLMDSNHPLDLKQSTYIQNENLFDYTSGNNFNFTIGLVDRLMIIKAEGEVNVKEIAKKIDDSVVEMEDLNTQLNAIKEAIKKINKSDNDKNIINHLDILDAVQMGNLDFFDKQPSENWIDDRNPQMVTHILKSFALKEKAFIAPGVSHFVGVKGILNLLEKEGVTVTRIELD